MTVHTSSSPADDLRLGRSQRIRTSLGCEPLLPLRKREPSSRRRALHWDFRTTDLDRVSDHRMPCDGRLAINATSRDGSRRIELVLSAPPSSFGSPLHVPTSDRGFSDEPGCRESPVATVSITAWERRFGDGGRGGDRPWWWRRRRRA